MLLLVQTLTVLDHPCVRLASSVRRASEPKSDGRGFESHVRLTLHLESKNLSTDHIYIYTYLIILIISKKFRLKQTWLLKKAVVEIKFDTEQAMKLD